MPKLLIGFWSWALGLRRKPKIQNPKPTITPASLARPRRIRVKRGRSILRRYRPQTWKQACYQFAWEHEGLHAWPTIGRVKVKQAVVELVRARQELGADGQPVCDLYLTIEHDLPHADRWEGWRLSADGKVIEHWAGRR